MKDLITNKYSLLILCFFIGTVVSFSQNQNTEWSAESYLVSINGTDVEITSNLTMQGTTFTWEQLGYNTTNTNTFTIASVTGNWNMQDGIGELNYELITSEDTLASLTVTGTTEGITLSLIVNGTNGATDNSYTFYIETFTNL